VYCLQTYNKPNVTLVTDRLEEITENGIRTKQSDYSFDTIIYATGFDLVKSMNAYKITGVGGQCFAEDMGDTPAAYKGVVVVSLLLVLMSMLSDVKLLIFGYYSPEAF
jgi:cation diffusion facilitator CzcD-associated flavoprotein CzcO